jgi:hypothetical protein
MNDDVTDVDVLFIRDRKLLHEEKLSAESSHQKYHQQIPQNPANNI